MAGPLTDALLIRVAEPLRTQLETRADLEGSLATLAKDSSAAWPTLSIDDAAFVAYVADRLDASAGADAIANVRGPDIYLACACTLGIPGAIENFEREFAPQIAKAIGHMDKTGTLVAEVQQALRTKLFAGADGGPGRIADFSGRSKLWRWTRVIAVRLALDLVQKEGKSRSLGDEDLPDEGFDLQLDYLKRKYAGQFGQAFTRAVGELEPRDRTLLKMSLIDGLSIDQIGGVHDVHRATAARWLQAAREKLAEKTKEIMRRDLAIDGDEMDSIMRLIRSRIDVSVRRLLTDPSD